jgi:hypothetical protein
MSSSRGYFVGQIIDELASISNQVETRAQLGQTDLNRLLEDFLRDILNIIYCLKLANLNTERSNAPGIDLGDAANGIAYQVTSRATSSKINKTLEKVTSEQLKAYPEIRIAVIGNKQTSYTLDAALVDKTNFKLDQLVDVTGICRAAISLPMLDLQSLHTIITQEAVRVRVDLELPDQNGKYPTDLEDYVERVGDVRRSDASAFAISHGSEGIFEDAAAAATSLHAFADALAQLPRISRQFLAEVMVRKEERHAFGVGSAFHANDDIIRRVIRYPDTEGELRILAHRGFLSLDTPEETHVPSAFWRITFPGAPSDFDLAFFGYLEEANLDLKQVIVGLDFSKFGKPLPA